MIYFKNFHSDNLSSQIVGMYQELLTIKEDERTLSSNITRISNDWELPPSYLEFTREVGFGRLLGLFLSYIPMGVNSPFCDALEHRNAYWKNIFQEYVDLAIFDEDEEMELLANAEPFMVSENGEVVFWDIRKSQNGEYPIYLVDFPVGIYFAGNNFQEFITNLTSETTYQSILKFRTKPLPPTFEPLSLIE